MEFAEQVGTIVLAEVGQADGGGRKHAGAREVLEPAGLVGFDDEIGDGLAGQLFAAALENEGAVIDNAEHAGHFVDFVEQVAGHHDGDALLGEVDDERPDFFNARGVQPVGGLVQDEQFGFPGQGHGDAEALFHAEGIVFDQLVLVFGQAHNVECLDDLSFLQPQHGLDDLEVFPPGEMPIAWWGLNHGANPAQQFGAAGFGEFPAVDEYLTGGGFHEPQEEFHGGGFPGTIGAEEPVDGALGHEKINVVDGAVLAECFGEPVGSDDVEIMFLHGFYHCWLLP